MMLAAVTCAALAGTSLDGSSGLVTAPTADTVPPGRLRASANLQWVRDFQGWSPHGLPVGFAAGVHDRVELGGSVQASPPVGWVTGAAPVGTGAYVRARAVDPVRWRPGLAAQLAARGLGREAIGEATAVAALDLPGGAVVAAGGVRGDASGWVATQAAGFEIRRRSWSIVAEQDLATGGSGLEQLEGRLGARLRLRERVGLLAWGGGGRAGGAPWAGGGLALQLASADPFGEDTDGDTVLDWTERCRFDPEDIDGFADADGCPDPDNDGDGAPDGADPTPNGEPLPTDTDLPGETGTLKMRIKPRPMPGPIHRGTDGVR